MSSPTQSFYSLSNDDESSDDLFYFLNQHFILFIPNYDTPYIDNDDDSDDDELPELIDDINEPFNYIEPFYIQNRSLYDTYRYKNVITEEVYDNLKKQNMKFKDLEEVEKKENIECSISLEKFNDEDYIIKLNCGHFFHREPILYWLYMQKNKCPLCRYEYLFIEKRIE
jgi:hypothetical protein